MTAHFLRRFLMIFVIASLFTPGITSAHPSEEESSEEAGMPKQKLSAEDQAIQAEFMQLLAKLEEIQESLTQPQSQLLMLLGQKYESKVSLLLFNAQTDQKALDAFVVQEKMSQEDALKLQKQFLAVLEKEKIQLSVAQDFFRTIQKLKTLQDLHGEALSSQELPATPSQEETEGSQEVQNLAQAQQMILQLKSLRDVLVLNPETDAEALAAFLEKLNSENEQKVSMETLLQFRTRMIDNLDKLGVPSDKIATLIAETKEMMMQKILTEKGPIVDLLTRNPETELEVFKKLAEKLTKALQQTISAEILVAHKGQMLEELESTGISISELQAFAKTSEDNAWWKKADHVIAAMTASTLFGIADLFTQTHKSIPQQIESTWNWLMDPFGFYPKPAEKAKKSQWQWSKAGTIGRIIECGAMIPTAYLWKDMMFATTLGGNKKALEGLKSKVEEFKSEYPRIAPLVSPALKLAPYAIPWYTGKAKDTSDSALQENLGAIKGKAVSLGCSKALPLATWMYWHRAKFRAAGNLLKGAIHKDQFEVWNNTAFAFAPLVTGALAQPIESVFSKITPKTGVFWQTFLSNGWGKRLVKIGYGTLLRAFLWQQYAKEDSADTSYATKFFSGLKVDRGTKVTAKSETVTETTRTCLYPTGAETMVKTKNTPKITECKGYVPLMANTDITTKDFIEITGKAILVPENYEVVRIDETNLDGSSLRQKCNTKTGEIKLHSFKPVIKDAETGKVTEWQQEHISKKIVNGKLVESSYQALANKRPTPTSGRSKTTKIITTGFATKSSERPKDRLSAVLPYLKRSLAQLVIEEGSVAATTSALYAANNKIARLGRGIAKAALEKAKDLEFTDEAGCKDAIEAAESFQFAAQTGSKLLLSLFGAMNNNPLALVNNPAQAEKVIAKIMSSAQETSEGSNAAQIFVHKLFANKLYVHIFKKLIPVILKKCNVSKANRNFLKPSSEDSYGTGKTMAAVAGWTALWLAATTILTDVPDADRKPKAPINDFDGSFEASEESLEEMANGSAEPIPA